MKFLMRITFIVLLICSLEIISYANINHATSYNSNDNIEVKKILDELRSKKKLVKTAEIEGKIIYKFPFRKRLKLGQHIFIEKESKIHVNVFAIWKIKVAEFVSNGELITYKRIGKRARIRDMDDFNLEIFNKKYLNLPLKIEELNNILLGMNVLDWAHGSYDYEIKDKKLILSENTNKCIIDLDTRQIQEILINDGRKVRIKYSKYAQFGEFNIHLPLRVEIITKTFSIQINHKDDILLNGKHIARNH